MNKYLSIWNGFTSTVKRDCLLSKKNLTQFLNPLLLFILVSASFPFAVNLNESNLPTIGPGVIWVIAILSFLLTLSNLYMHDLDDGCLDYMLLSPQPLPILTFAKTFAHWVLSGLPIVLICPFVAIFYQMELDDSLVLALTLTIGTFALSLIGSIGAALTLSTKNNSILQVYSFFSNNQYSFLELKWCFISKRTYIFVWFLLYWCILHVCSKFFPVRLSCGTQNRV